MWLQGHMGPMQPAGSGLWVQMSPTGELIQASHLHHRGGISGSSPKAYHLDPMTVSNSMVLLLHQPVEEVGVG